MSYQGQQPTNYQGQQPTNYQDHYQQGGYQQGGYQPQQVHISVGGNSAASDPDFMKAQSILQSEFCSCLSDPLICLLSFCLPHCQFGLTYSSLGNNCLVGCCCYCLLCCSTRPAIQRVARTPEDSCPMACLIHWFCSPCAIAQEARAVKHLKAAHLRTPVM
jgi:Cys-rich protein (TIGR01571 family)